MATGLGFKGVMAMGRQTAFQTALAAPTDRVPFYSESIVNTPEFVDSDFLNAVAAIEDTTQVFKPVAGSIEIPLVYDTKDTTIKGSGLPLGLAMGNKGTWDAGTSAIQLLLSDAGFISDANRACATLAVEKNIDVWQSTGCYINQMTISGNAKENVRATMDVMAQTIVKTGGSFSAAEIAALANEVTNLILFSYLDFRCADTDNALASSDRKSISGFSISLSNNLTEAQQATAASSVHTDSELTIENVRNDFREVTVEFTVPRYDSTFWQSALDDGTNLQARLAFVKSAGSQEFYIYLPMLRVQSVPAPIDGANVITQTVSCKAILPDHEYMKFKDASTVVSTELGIETINGRTEDLW